MEAIRRGGLRVSGAFGEHVVSLPAAESPRGLDPGGRRLGGPSSSSSPIPTRRAPRRGPRHHLLAPEGVCDHLPERDRERRDAPGGAGDGTGARRLQHVQRPRRGARPRGDDPPRPHLGRGAGRAAHRPTRAGGRCARAGRLRGPRHGRHQRPDLDQVHRQQRDQRALRDDRAPASARSAGSPRWTRSRTGSWTRRSPW